VKGVGPDIPNGIAETRHVPRVQVHATRSRMPQAPHP
jgi:hypothetical protein